MPHRTVCHFTWRTRTHTLFIVKTKQLKCNSTRYIIYTSVFIRNFDRHTTDTHDRQNKIVQTNQIKSYLTLSEICKVTDKTSPAVAYLMSNFLSRFAKLQYAWQIEPKKLLTMSHDVQSILLVLNIFINNLFTTKSKELSSDVTRGHASSYNKLKPLPLTQTANEAEAHQCWPPLITNTANIIKQHKDKSKFKATVYRTMRDAAWNFDT